MEETAVRQIASSRLLPLGPGLVKRRFDNLCSASAEALGKLDDLLPEPRTAGILVIPAVPD